MSAPTTAAPAARALGAHPLARFTMPEAGENQTLLAGLAGFALADVPLHRVFETSIENDRPYDSKVRDVLSA